MAKLYGEIAKSALLTLDKSFSRALGQPLDASEVYYSLEAAQTYAATPAAYVGQKIVVIENGKVTHYSVDDTAGTLKEVGVRPTGDGKSIEVSAEGVVSILGAAGADSLTLPRMKEDKSGVEWVPVSAVVQGDGNDNTTYTFTELTKGEGDSAETYGFVVKTFFNGTEVEGGSIEIAFDVYTKSEADAKFLAKTDAYDDTALANRVTAVENNKADKSTTYTKTEVDTAIDEAKKSILGEDVAEAYDTLKEIQEILEGTDGETIDGLIETVADNKAKIETLNGDATTDGSVAKQIADAVAPLATTEALNGVKATAEAAQTAEQVDEAIEAAFTEANLGQYATTEALNQHAQAAEEAYAKKATTLEGYGITDAYTKNEIDAKIGTPGTPAVKDSEGNVTTEAVAGTGVFASTYSKAELNAMLDEIEGGSTESAASVARQLDEYKTSNNQRVADLETKVGKDVNGEEPATGLFLEVDEARAQADKGVTDAAAASQAVTQLANGQVATNKTNIENLQALVGAIGDGSANTLAGKIGALEAHDQAHATEFSTLSGKVDQNTADIAKKANATDVYTKGEVDAAIAPLALAANVYSKTDADDKFLAKADYEAYDDTAVKGLITAEETRAKAEEERIVGLITAEAERADAAEKANAQVIADLTNGAVKKNTDDIAALDAVLKAAIENEDDTALNSIKELAVWIEEHETEVLPVINAHSAVLAGFGGEDQPAVIKTYIDESIAAIPTYELPAATADNLGGIKASKSIAVATDGTATVAKVTTDVLAQGTEELVLNGGSANA